MVRVESIINGVLAGLVGITAGCHIVPFWSALVIGGVASILALVGEHILLHRFKLDDVISAFPVHGLAGIWGTLAVALFSSDPAITVGTQLVGIGVAAVWAFGLGFIIIYLLKITFGIRVSDEDQRQGLNYTEHGAKTTWLDLVESMSAISEGDADLSKKLEIEYGSESGAVANLFNRIIDRIADLVRLVQLQSREMDASSAELAAAAEAIASAVAEQSAEMESFAGSVRTLKNAMESIDRTSAEQTAELGRTKSVTDSVITDFDEFEITVTSTSDSANELNRTMDMQHALVESSSARLEDMRQVSTHIGNLVEILTAISKQLNLLSINAAIEAARSGEAGQGFSIVAMEINNLSNQTSESTGKAGEFLQEVDAIIEGSLGEFKQITENFKELRGMVHRIHESGESMVKHNEHYRSALSDVASTMATSEDLTGTLRRSTQSQMNEFNRVYTNIENLASAVQELSAQAEELHATSESLRSSSGKIRQSVDQFKVEKEIN